MDIRGVVHCTTNDTQYQQPTVSQVPQFGSKRKCCDCMHQVQGLYFREQPVREEKKRFWIDLFYEKTGKEIARGTKKVCFVVKQDDFEFVLLKAKANLSEKDGAILLDSFYQERNIQLILSKFEDKYVNIIDSFLLPSRKNPQVIKWITIAEKYQGDFTIIKLSQYVHMDSYILQIALRMQEIIKEMIVLPDFKLDNVVFLKEKSTITDFGSAHLLGVPPAFLSMTFGYMSPERDLREDGGYPAMIFAFGVCMAQLVYLGNIPFPSEKLEKKGVKVLDKSCQAEYKKNVISWRKKMPANKYRALIQVMTSINAEGRPTIDQVVNSIRAIHLRNPN